MTAAKRAPARMKPVEAWAVVSRGRLVRDIDGDPLVGTLRKHAEAAKQDGERLARVRIVEIAEKKGARK